MPAKRPDADTLALGRVVRELREARGWTQVQLGEAITQRTHWAVDNVMVARIERGQRVTPLRDREALAETFGVDVAVLNVKGDPFEYSEMDEWRDQARLAAARDRLREAATAFGELFAAFDERTGDKGEREAGKIARDGFVDGWSRQVEQENG